jgi:hypothetical protein
VILRCNSDGDLYTIPPATTTTPPHAGLVVSCTVWHHHLGHPGSAILDNLRNNSSIICNKGAHTLCHSCQLGKHVRLPFDTSSSHSNVPIDVVHCDVWTSPVPSISGFRYYLVMLDDFSHFCWTFPLTHKSEVHKHMANFCAFVQTQFGLPVRNIQADNGTEFANHNLKSFLSSRSTLKVILSVHLSSKRESPMSSSHFEQHQPHTTTPRPHASSLLG